MTKELSGAGQHSHVFSSSSIKAVLTHQYPGEGKDREGVCSGCKELQRAAEGPTISEIQKIWRLGSMETCTDWQVCLCSEGHWRIFLTLNALSSTSWLQPDLDKPRGSGRLSHLPSLRSGATVTTDPKGRSSTKRKAYEKNLDGQ